ncbi:MAG: hypothetical protein QW279_03700 [Candidatus Jordarchaeaceae archaeon]
MGRLHNACRENDIETVRRLPAGPQVDLLPALKCGDSSSGMSAC